MEKKILVAVDESANAMRTVAYVGEMLATHPEVEVTLFHVIAGFFPMFTEDLEVSVLPELRTRWEEETKRSAEELFKKARAMLREAGLPEGRIKSEYKTGGLDVAQEILAEAQRGGYQTVALGRRGLSRVKQFFMGSVSAKVVQHAKGHTIWVVE